MPFKKFEQDLGAPNPVASKSVQLSARVEIERPRYMSITRWTQFSGMGTTTTYAALATGQLKAIKVGRKTLIDVD